jgi:hypothetical protein
LRYVQIKVLITLAGIIAAMQLPGQSGFNFVYNNPYGEISGMRFADVVISNDTLTVIGTYGDDNLQKPGVIILQIDTLGKVLQISTIVDSTGYSKFITDPKFQVSKSSRGTFLIPIFDFGFQKTYYAEVDSDLDMISFKGYEHNDFLMLPIEIINVNRGAIIFGRIQRLTGDVMPFALAVDANGKELWRRYFGANNVPYEFGSAVKVHDNEFVLGCGILGNTSGEEEGIWSQPWIFAIDSLGNILWDWKGEKHGGNSWIASNLRRTSDGGWVYTPSQRFLIEVFPTIFESQYAPMLVKRDSSMMLEWSVDYDFTPRASITKFYDSFVDTEDFVYMVGQRGKYYDGTGAIVGWVLKSLSLQESSELWQVTDTGRWSIVGSENYLSGVTVAESGSVFACGRTRISSEPQAWLIKITADGCIDTLCTTTSLTDLIDKDSHKFRIFPNPSRGEFTVEADQQKQGDYVFALYDLYGRLEMHERFDQTATISTSYHAPPGIYVYVIRDAGTGRQLQSGKVMIE